MKTVFGKAATLVFALLFLGGCVSAGNPELKGHTEESIDAIITQGVTTYDNLVLQFGVPHSHFLNENGSTNAVWRLDRRTPNAESVGAAVLTLGISTIFSAKDNLKVYELSVLFDENEVVQRHKWNIMEGEVASGVLH